MSCISEDEEANEAPVIPADLRIVLVGKVQAGKTSVLKTLLRSSEENKKLPPEFQNVSPTEKCQKVELMIQGQKIVVVDTPGLCNAEKEDKEVMEEIKKCVELADPGPHVFLFVLDLETFTKGGQDMVKIIKNTFDDDIVNYTMVLFTHGDELENNGTTIEDFIQRNDYLKEFVEKCKGGCHVIENRENRDQSVSQSQVTTLLQKINDMLQENGGKHYTPEMLKKALKTDQNRVALKKKIAFCVLGFALAGAGVGAVAAHFVEFGIEGLAGGAAVGAVVGGVVGGAVIVAVEHIKVALRLRRLQQADKRQTINM